MGSQPRPQNILVVGGAQGIGLEVTKAILSINSSNPDSAARVCVFGLHVDREFEALGRRYVSRSYGDRLSFIKGDVTSASDREKAIETFVKERGGIDTLVYTAGVITPIERIEKVDLEDVKRAYDVNVFGTIAMCQLALPYLRKAAFSNRHNAAYGKILILSSACDSPITYSGWMPYCTTKAALTRFIQCLAHEEPILCVQGVYPKLTRTKMPEDVIAGKYKGIMGDHEIERFRIWNEMGEEMVEPAQFCGEAVAKLAVGLFAGAKSGEVRYYDEHVPSKPTRT